MDWCNQTKGDSFMDNYHGNSSGDADTIIRPSELERLIGYGITKDEVETEEDANDAEGEKHLTEYERCLAEAEKLLERSRVMRAKANAARDRLAKKIGSYFLKRFPEVKTTDAAEKIIDAFYEEYRK